MKNKIPKWVTIILCIFAIWGIISGIIFFFSPQIIFQKIDLSPKGLSLILDLFAARQISIALIIGYALIKKSFPMIKLAVIAYLIMNIQDTLIGLIHNEKGLMIGAFVFCIILVLMLNSLSKIKHD